MKKKYTQHMLSVASILTLVTVASISTAANRQSGEEAVGKVTDYYSSSTAQGGAVCHDGDSGGIGTFTSVQQCCRKAPGEGGIMKCVATESCKVMTVSCSHKEDNGSTSRYTVTGLPYDCVEDSGSSCDEESGGDEGPTDENDMDSDGTLEFITN